MEIKYEPVFGDQSLFYGAPEEVTHVTKGGGFYNIENMSAKYVSDGIFNGADVLSVGGYLIAERRIIRTPTWSIADQKAGKLPDVGAKFLYKDEELCCHYVDSNGEIWANNFKGEVMTPLLREITPIESPEEKAHRLRSEWVKHALDLYMSSPKNDVASMGDVYDALLSGELKSP